MSAGCVSIRPSDIPGVGDPITAYEFDVNVIDFQNNGGGLGRFRMDFHYIRLIDRTAGFIGPSLQNQEHQFADDVFGLPGVITRPDGRGLYISGQQLLYYGDRQGSEVLTPHRSRGEWGRAFIDIDSLGSICCQTMTRSQFPLTLKYHVRVAKVGEETNPQGNIEKDDLGNWLAHPGDYTTWLIWVNFEGDEDPNPIAKYWMPVASGTSLHREPFALGQEYFDTAPPLSSHPCETEYYNFRYYDGEWRNIAEMTIHQVLTSTETDWGAFVRNGRLVLGCGKTGAGYPWNNTAPTVMSLK